MQAGGTATSDGFNKVFHGANVTFQAGAEISKIKLPSDYSSFELADLPTGAKPGAVRDILSAFGFDVPVSSIHVKSTKPSGSIAIVAFDDPNSAKAIVEKIGKELTGGDGTSEFSIKLIQSAARFRNRLQLSSVTCSWSAPLSS
jgi:hypothetical protein